MLQDYEIDQHLTADDCMAMILDRAEKERDELAGQVATLRAALVNADSALHEIRGWYLEDMPADGWEKYRERDRLKMEAAMIAARTVLADTASAAEAWRAKIEQETRVERDRTWCLAVLSAVDLRAVQEITRAFNAARPDTPLEADAFAKRQGEASGD